MNKYHPLLKLIFLLSIAFIIAFEFLAKDSLEWFSGAGLLVDNVVVLSQSYLVGFTIYLLSAYYPWTQQEERRLSEQQKIDEIIARRLKKLMTNCIFVLYHGMDYKKEQHLVFLEPLNEEEFQKLGNDVFHWQSVRHARSIRVPGEQYARMMTVGENILDSTLSVKKGIDELLKFERYMDIELVTLLYHMEESTVISNWQNYIDDTPIILGNQVLKPQPSPIGTYHKMFKEFDELYRCLELKLLNLTDTNACEEYSHHIETLKNKASDT
ncbi:hypothetical protein [Aeromonas hydrophila]|uniref:hypothetical protein n=1 Tax=Aeromonas hydrophila TaxID=644 RepID=UPI0038CFE6CB